MGMLISINVSCRIALGLRALPYIDKGMNAESFEIKKIYSPTKKKQKQALGVARDIIQYSVS